MKVDNIRNFCIVAHVDHGKSTLADRFLEITKTVPKEKMQEQFLDQNPISRERGITIKLAPVRMNYTLNANNYTLNLIDTPGHVDFSYEVSRTLAACEGVILLVDATQGIQAQTVAHFQAAKKQNLVIIPAINKIDMPNAKPDILANDLCETFGFKKEEIVFVSAKTGENVEELLSKVVEKIPSSKGEMDPLRALVFDAVYDEHRGVVAFVRVFDGKVKKGDNILFFQKGTKTVVSEVGVFSPFLKPKEELSFGEIGYIITGIKDIRQSEIGDTVTMANGKWQMANGQFLPLPGYDKPKPMVFFGVYPKDTSEFPHLKEALNRLSLKDASLDISLEHSVFLGNGFRIGFLGLLHAQVIKERIFREFNLEPLFTMPRVLYQISTDGKKLEPYMSLTIYVPQYYLGGVMTLCQKRKGDLIEMTYKTFHVVLQYEMPYSMLLFGIISDLKSVSAGFASVDYKLSGYKEADLVELEVCINETPIDVLSELIYSDEAMFRAQEKAKKLKETLPRQQFRQIIQAKVGGKILSREDIPPFRKDVLKKMSGGDRTRKDKLLDKQKKGKERLKAFSKVVIPQKALYSLLENN